MPGEDPRIAAFARTNRRRNALALAVLGLAAVIGCAIGLVLVAMQPAEVLAGGEGRHRGSGYQVLVMLGGGVLIGIGVLVAAYRILRGERAIDYNPLEVARDQSP